MSESVSIAAFTAYPGEEAGSLLPASAPRSVDRYIDHINALLADESVSDIMINRYDRVFVERAGRMAEAGFTIDSVESVAELARIIIHLCGRDDMAARSPLIDGMLPDGNRVNVVLPPVAVEGPTIAIRKFPKEPIVLDAMVRSGALTTHVAEFLKAAARARLNILVSGGTSSGKTTLLNAISGHIGEGERVVTIEDTPELRIMQKNLVRMEGRELGEAQGEGRITARDLVKTSLRMRPDRIIMGEIRGAEAFDLMQAINTGHDGSMATIHANNPREAFSRLEQMISMASMNLPQRYIRQQIASALDLVVQMARDAHGQRRVAFITEIVGLEGEILTTQDLFALKEGPKGVDPSYVWANVTSRNKRVQQAIQESRRFADGQARG